jgi:hypothetical protein
MVEDVFRMDWGNKEKKLLKEFTMDSDNGYVSRTITASA